MTTQPIGQQTLWGTDFLNGKLSDIAMFQNMSEKQNATDMISSVDDRSAQILREQCPNCNRRFFQGKLFLHLKSCKPGKTLKRIAPKNEVLRLTDTPSLGPKVTNRTGEHQQQLKRKRSGFDIVNRQEENEFLCEEPRASNSKSVIRVDSIQQPQNNGEKVQQLVSCTKCDRKFLIDRFQKHSKICLGSNKLRPIFDSKAHRMSEQVLPNTTTSIAILNEAASQEILDTNKQKKKPKWKIQHQQFIMSVKSLRQKAALKQDSIQKPVLEIVKCQYCLRRLNSVTVQTHNCRNKSRLPKKIQNPKVSSTQQNIRNQLSSSNIPSNKSLQIVNKLPTQIIKSTFQSQQKYTIDQPSKALKKISNRKVYGAFDHAAETNTFAGFVKKYQNVIARATNYSKVQCPHCHRRFGQKASQRHIPICSQIYRYKKSVGGLRKQRVSKAQEHKSEEFCGNCHFKFWVGHKYCSNCGKKRQ